MLKRTPHAAFSYVITRNRHDKGDFMFVDATAEKRSHIFYVKGKFIWKDNSTGVEVNNCLAGDFIPGADGLVGVFKGEALDEESIFFCVDPKSNKKELPELTPVRITSQTPYTSLAGTKLFLCEGSVLIKDREITAPAQIKLSSDTIIFCVNNPAYGLIFP
jgi:hypothetical protein